MEDQKDNNVRSITRALDILASFDDDHPEMGIGEIAQIVGLNKATAHRIVTTLLRSGYIERGSDGIRYRLGLRLADLGFNVIRRMDLRREAYPLMFMLVQRFGEACDLSLFDRGEVFCVEFVKGIHTMAVADAIGQRFPVNCTASGKLFLAYLPSTELETILSNSMVPFTEHTIVAPDELLRHLEGIRQLGYAVDDEEYTIGTRAAAAPIFGHDGRIVAALSIPGPTSRITRERISEVGEALRESANAVSRRLGWKANPL